MHVFRVLLKTRWPYTNIPTSNNVLVLTMMMHGQFLKTVNFNSKTKMVEGIATIKVYQDILKKHLKCMSFKSVLLALGGEMEITTAIGLAWIVTALTLRQTGLLELHRHFNFNN